MLAALLKHRGSLRHCWAHVSRLGAAPLIENFASSRTSGFLPAAHFSARPLPSGTGWNDRQYPFKPPLRRVRQGGRWMQRSPAAAGGQRAPPPWARRGRRPGRPSTRLALPPPASGGQATALVGNRRPWPDLARLSAARAARAAAAGGSNVTRQDVWEETALSHNTGMQLLFLGTGTGRPAEARRAGSLALKTLRSIWLFDCGEDTQRQLHRQPLIRHGRVDRIFLTNARGANLLGLPGMLCTMSAARAVGLDSADVPLHLYGPPGLAEFLRPLLQLSDTYIAMPVLVHELVEHAVPAGGAQRPECLDRRSCLFRGWHDGEVVPLLDRARARTNALAKGQDARANLRELPLPPPGDPGADLSGRREALRWTIRCERDQLVTAVRVPAPVPSWAFVVTEADRVGRLDVDRCQQLRVPPGKLYSELKDGRPVRNTAGKIVKPEQVLGPDIPGRTLVVVGESSDASALAGLVRGADCIVHAASHEVAAPDGTSTAVHVLEQAAALARAAEARHLLLYRFAPGGSPAQAAQPGGGEPAERADAASSLDRLNPLNACGPLAGNPIVMGRFEFERRRMPGGHLCHARSYWEHAEGPADAVAATRARAEALLGRPGAVSLAEDMALFAVDRRQPPGEAAQAGSQERRAAAGAAAA